MHIHRAPCSPAVPAITSNPGKCSFLKDTFKTGSVLIRLHVFWKAGPAKLLAEANLMAGRLCSRAAGSLPLQWRSLRGCREAPEEVWVCLGAPVQGGWHWAECFSARVGLGLVSSFRMNFSSRSGSTCQRWSRLHGGLPGLVQGPAFPVESSPAALHWHILQSPAEMFARIT